MSGLKQLSSMKCFGGFVKKFSHMSSSTKTEMKFSVFLPHQQTKAPALYFLSGLTCTEDNFIQKAGACRAAAKNGIALICPDTSPRGLNISGDNLHWDFGVGAGFYVNATQSKWSTNYRMYDYVVSELPALVKQHLPLNGKQSITGHSMGGHGSLICFLKNPGLYSSVSAFSPICNPILSPWGIKAFTGYLGDNKDLWKEYDATCLVQNYSGPQAELLIDVGTADEHLEKQLMPENLEQACKNNKNVRFHCRLQEGYDHGYFFIQTFIDDHINFHSRALSKTEDETVPKKERTKRTSNAIPKK